MGLVVQEMGLVVLAKEEAQASERQRAGKSISPLQNLILKLRTLDPNGIEFYKLAAAHLRRRFRPNRTYGVFFIFFGTLPLLLAVFYGAPLWFGAGAYLIFGALGFLLFYHSSATVRNLSEGHESEDATSRLTRLRKVALNNQQDPVAALVLQLTGEICNESACKQA